MSEKVYTEVEGKLKAGFEDRGERHLKNISKPVRAYAVCAAYSSLIDRLSTAPALPDKPSIAVLPFENLSGDPEQEYFADGMVEDIIAGLSRNRLLFVIARNSSFAYKGKFPDIRQVESIAPRPSRSDSLRASALEGASGMNATIPDTMGSRAMRSDSA